MLLYLYVLQTGRKAEEVRSSMYKTWSTHMCKSICGFLAAYSSFDPVFPWFELSYVNIKDILIK